MVIYKTTNLVNGKIYIGQNIRNEPNYKGSGLMLNRAIEKYGSSNFKKEILEFCDSKKNLNEREIFWIKKLNSTNTEIGYNISTGGMGGNLGPKWLERVVKANRIIHKNPEIRRKISLKMKGKVSPMKGKIQTKSHIESRVKEIRGKKQTKEQIGKRCRAKKIYLIDLITGKIKCKFKSMEHLSKIIEKNEMRNKANFIYNGNHYTTWFIPFYDEIEVSSFVKKSNKSIIFYNGAKFLTKEDFERKTGYPRNLLYCDNTTPRKKYKDFNNKLLNIIKYKDAKL